MKRPICVAVVAVAVWLSSPDLSDGADGVHKWTGPDGKVYYGNEASGVSGSSRSGQPPDKSKGPPTSAKDPREEAIRFVNEARAIFSRCDISMKSPGYTKTQRQVVETCLSSLATQKEEMFKGLEDRLSGRPAIQASLASFMATWRSALMRMPPEISENSIAYKERKAAIQEEIDRAVAQVSSAPL